MGRNLRGLGDSFRYACRGFFYCVRGERNIRIHLTAAALVLWLSSYYGLTAGEYAALFFAMGLVLTCEMLNTAVEVLVDLHTKTYHHLARVAKDVAAGAVLVSAVTSSCVGLSLFWDLDRFRFILAQLMERPARLALPVTILLAGCFFVFGLPRERRGRRDAGSFQ